MWDSSSCFERRLTQQPLLDALEIPRIEERVCWQCEQVCRDRTGAREFLIRIGELPRELRQSVQRQRVTRRRAQNAGLVVQYD